MDWRIFEFIRLQRQPSEPQSTNAGAVKISIYADYQMSMNATKQCLMLHLEIWGRKQASTVKALLPASTQASLVVG